MAFLASGEKRDSKPSIKGIILKDALYFVCQCVLHECAY